MRVALVLLAVAGCAKQAAERPASTAAEPKAESSKAADTAPHAPPPPTTTLEAPAPGGGPVTGGAPPPDTRPKLDQQAATDQARGQGMLGPTDDGSAFEPLDKSSGKRGAPHGSVTIAKSDVKNEVLMDKLHGAMTAIEACYDDTLAKQPLVAGELTLKLAGDKVTIVKSTLQNVALGKCVLDAIRKTSPNAKATITLAFKAS